MTSQTTNRIMMVRPVNFRYNEQTAANNYYQKVLDNLKPAEVQANAQKEFDNFVVKLRNKGIEVVVIEDTPEPDTPDSIFPNNWISFHDDGRVALYPMYAHNRRLERRDDILTTLENDHHLKISGLADFSYHEKEEKYLEGTGSMVLDRPNKIAYAAVSIRTNSDLLGEFCKKFAYKPIRFTANQTVDGHRLPIYHTNVMMCVAEDLAVICLSSIDEDTERKNVEKSLLDTGKEIIEISEEQKHRFAGNMLQVNSDQNDKFMVMSTAAYKSLDGGQIDNIEKHCPIIHSSLDTIEALGGGSARCMMAEVFLPVK